MAALYPLYPCTLSEVLQAAEDVQVPGLLCRTCSVKLWDLVVK